jgi:hypothetical protein
VEAAVDVQTKLQKARQAMADGRTDDARKDLDAAGSGLTGVRSDEGKDTLASQQQDLATKLSSAPAGQPINVADPAGGASSGTPSPSKDKPPSSSAVPTPAAPPARPATPQSSGGPGSSPPTS